MKSTSKQFCFKLIICLEDTYYDYLHGFNKLVDFRISIEKESTKNCQKLSEIASY